MSHVGRFSGLRRTAAAAAVLLAALVVAPIAATAGGSAGGAGTAHLTSGAWGVDPAATTITSAPPCLTSPISCGAFTSSGSSPWYLNIWNTGTVNLLGVSYVISFSGGVTPKLTLKACSVAWTQSGSGSCSGTTTSVLTNKAAGTSAVTVGLPTAPGREIFLQATPSGSPSSVTIGTAVCSGTSSCGDGATSGQIRAPSTTNT
jgi:hypothetical protein